MTDTPDLWEVTETVDLPDGLETVILSDLHLTDAEPVSDKRPYWRAYKQRRFFIDHDFGNLLEYVTSRARSGVELILNGDTFDFDGIVSIPDETPGPISWLSHLRGMPSEEWMSLYKADRIVEDHKAWFGALRTFLTGSDDRRVVFVIGNHDVELHWPSVQARIIEAIDLPDDALDRVTFAPSFYISGEDTYVSHGHLYDPLCTEPTPSNPLIQIRGRPRVRIPFGDMAARYMLNGMGYFNPHAAGNYIMSARQYFGFFFKFMARTQPFLLWTWFWSAAMTLFLSLRDYWTPAMRDPLVVEEKTQAIAERSNATPSMVRQLEALNVPSACNDPLKIARVLWLDRGLLFLAVLYLAFQATLAVNFVWPISPWWAFLFIALLFPGFIIYSFRVRPAEAKLSLMTEERAIVIHRVTKVSQAVFGHTHVPVIENVGPLHYVNGGFWSPAFREPTCENRIGTQTFVWLKPSEGPRRAELWEWPPGGEAPSRVSID